MTSYIRTKTNNDDSDQGLYVLSIIFLSVYYILPQYFGIPTPVFDFSAQRIMIVVFLFYLIEKRSRVTEFVKICTSSTGTGWLFIYMFVLAYTTVFRTHIGTLLYSLIESIGMFIIVYIIKKSLGVERTIKLILCFGYILCILGIIEYGMHRTPFSYLLTIKGIYTGSSFRSGNYRIMGPANVYLAYGLILITLFPLSCINFKNKTINLLQNKVLFLLISVNVILTGSRSTLAIFIIELISLFIFSERETRKKTFIAGIVIIITVAFLVFVTQGSSFSNYILLQVTSVIDEIFDTTYSAKYGADLVKLHDSSEYRKYLPQIFVHEALNPILGRGSQGSFAWWVDGYLIDSIDNFYVALYIRYAYPGMISYIFYCLTFIVSAIKQGIKTKSGITLALFVGIAAYFLNLWWIDTLMTIKYVYVLFALLIADTTFETSNQYAEGGLRTYLR